MKFKKNPLKFSIKSTIVEVKMYKVHWIIDGIANVNEKTQEDAEKIINSKIQKFLSEHSDFFDKIGAKAIQGKAYLPGKDEENEK